MTLRFSIHSNLFRYIIKVLQFDYEGYVCVAVRHLPLIPVFVVLAVALTKVENLVLAYQWEWVTGFNPNQIEHTTFHIITMAVCHNIYNMPS